LQVSRTPVREALLRLERDGLVRVVPRVGFFVQEITKRDLTELFELRELLETHAARKAASRLTDAELAAARALLEEGRDAVSQQDLTKFLETEIEFHTLVIERSNNRWLAVMMESVRDLTYRVRVLSLQSLENLQQSCEEHQRIFDALVARDGDAAGLRMSEHIRNVKTRLLEFPQVPEDKIV